MTRWITSGPTGEPPAWRYFEPPSSWPKWAHNLACTPCRVQWSRKLPERLRWRIAYAMDHLPGQCWSNLVSFALGWRRSPWQPVDSVCRSDAESCGACYCGRLEAARQPDEPAVTSLSP